VQHQKTVLVLNRLYQQILTQEIFVPFFIHHELHQQWYKFGVTNFFTNMFSHPTGKNTQELFLNLMWSVFGILWAFSNTTFATSTLYNANNFTNLRKLPLFFDSRVSSWPWKHKLEMLTNEPRQLKSWDISDSW
jgi:hypothetical protein